MSSITNKSCNNTKNIIEHSRLNLFVLVGSFRPRENTKRFNWHHIRMFDSNDKGRLWSVDRYCVENNFLLHDSSVICACTVISSQGISLIFCVQSTLRYIRETRRKCWKFLNTTKWGCREPTWTTKRFGVLVGCGMEWFFLVYFNEIWSNYNKMNVW